MAVAGAKQSKPFVNYTAGVFTESSPLNAPENTSQVDQNFILHADGSRERRLGLADFYKPAVVLGGTCEVVNSYRWSNPDLWNNKEILVVQYGNKIHLYTEDKICGSNYTEVFSFNMIYYQTNWDNRISDHPASFAAANGVLYIAHKDCEPLKVRFNLSGVCRDSGTGWSVEVVKMYERDFAGKPEDDPFSHPTTLTSYQYYNLRNRGWTDYYLQKYYNEVKQFPSLSEVWHLGFYTDQESGEEKWSVAELRKSSNKTTTAPEGHFIVNVFDTCEIIDSNEDQVTVVAKVNPTDCSISIKFPSKHNLAVGNVVQLNNFTVTHTSSLGTETQNVDGLYTVSSTNSALISDIVLVSDTELKLVGELTLCSSAYTAGDSTYTVSQDAGVTLPPDGDGLSIPVGEEVLQFPPLNVECCKTKARPDVVAVYAGRVWWSSIQSGRLVNRVYYSQVLTEEHKDERYYQQNDPTARDFNELLKSDGGYIDIPDMGTPLGKAVMKDSLQVITTSGVWAISGDGYGFFAATSYSVSKLTDIGAVSKKSITVLEDSYVFAASTGVYLIATDLSVNNITDTHVYKLYRRIPFNRKSEIDIYYNKYDKTIHVLYSESPSTACYKYCTELVLDTRIKAWYSFDYGSDALKHAFCTGNSSSQAFDKFYIGVDADWFAMSNCDFIDFEGFPYQQDATAYFLSKPDSAGEIMYDKKVNEMHTWSSPDSMFRVRLRWDFACADCSTGYTVSKEGNTNVEVCDNSYARVAHREEFKFNGKGRVVEFEFQSIEKKPLLLYGWGVIYESAEK